MKLPFRGLTSPVAAVALVLTAALAVAQPNASEVRAAFPTIRLPAQLRGPDAVGPLSNQLPALAAYYRKDPETLRRQLEHDKSLWIDRNGRLFYVCDATPSGAIADTNAGAPPAQLVPLTETFKLHSKPGSTKTIFLDFDGHTISGTAWNDTKNGGAPIVAPAWDTDGNPGSFSNGELTVIQQVWLRVAEDFAPFDVDVTTEFPGEAALTRSSSGDQVYGTRALVSAIGDYFGDPGGIAYVGVFDNTGDYYKPALIFPENLGNSEKNIAEALSHEVGHNLGLSHDGIVNGAEYFGGHGNWAPIMGTGYSEPLSQWSKGEYANANNTEDDLLIITQNGLSYRIDDHGNTRFSATPLSGTSITNRALIERNTDVDYFTFTSGSGQAQIRVNPAERGGNLHLRLAIYDSAGVAITNREVADTSSGAQPVAANVSLTSGTYYISVANGGSGNPLTDGYTTYGSLGEYTLTVSLPGVASWVPVAGGGYSWMELANWSGGIPNTLDANARFTNDISGDQIVTVDGSALLGSLSIGDADGSHVFAIEPGAGGSLNFNTTGIDATIVKASGANDTITTPISLFKRLVVRNDAASSLTLGPISGNQPLVKTGSGILILSDAASYTGDTLVEEGTLRLSDAGQIANSARIQISSGAALDVSAIGGWATGTNQTLSGSGAVVGDVALDAGAALTPGNAAAAGTLTFSNHLALSGGAALSFDLNPETTPGGGTNDLIEVMGTLALNGSNTYSVNILGEALITPAVYTVIRYGALDGSITNLTYAAASTRYQVALDDSIPGEIRLLVTGGTPGAITWIGDGSANQWNVGEATNWSNGVEPDRFFQLDAVTFDDAGSSTPQINLTGSLIPGAVNVTGAKNYTFGGSGKLAGTMSLTKQGTGTLMLNTANHFTGPVTISGGMLRPGNASALGTSNTIAVNSGGTLDLNGINLSNRVLAIGGAGVGNSGAVINTGAAQPNAVQHLMLTDHTTVGGSTRWDVRPIAPGGFAGNDFNLTKLGAGEFWIANAGNTSLGNVLVRQGILGLEGNTTLGNSNTTFGVWPNTALLLSNTSVAQQSWLRMTNASLRSEAGSNVWNGSITFANSNYLAVTAPLTLRGSIAGAGSLVKAGASLLTLSGSNTFTGVVYADTASAGANDGFVRLASPTALSNASSIQLRNNNSGFSTLQLDGSSGSVTIPHITLSGRNNSTVAVQSLTGTNRIAGNLTLQTGGSNYLFQSDAGLLTLAGAVPLGTPGGSRTITFQGGGNFLVSGLIQNGTGGGTVNLTKSGTGTLTLTSPGNSFSGVTTVQAGVLQLGNGGAGGKLGTGRVVNNGVILIDRADNFIWNNDVSGTGKLTKVNTNAVTLTVTNLYLSQSSPSVQINGGTLQINSSGRIAANNEFWIAQNANTAAVIVNGGRLISTNWIAVGRNNVAAIGSLTLNSGTIEKSGGGNIIMGSLGGTGTLTVNGGTILNNSRILLGESASGKGYLDLNGGIVHAASVARFGGNTAIVRFNGGTLRAITNASAFLSNLSQALVQAGGAVFDDAGFGITNSQILLEDSSSPGGGLAKKGNGLLSLNTLNHFRGETRIVAGTLRLGHGRALQNSTLNLAAEDAGTLNFGSLNAAVLGGLAGGRNLALENANGVAVALTVGDNGSNTVYSGAMSGGGSLVKNGGGSLVLSGLNSFSGATDVNGGGLVVDGSLGAGMVNINNGTLAGNGTIGGDVAIQTLGTLAPGNGIGTLSVNSLALFGETVMEISPAGPTSDRVIVAGALSRGGSLVITNIGGDLAAGDSFTLFDAGSTSGSFSSITLPPLAPALRWETNQLASTGTISVVAMPSPPVAAFLSGTNLSLEFPTETGISYVLESTTNLIAPVLWLPRSTNQGNGASMLLQIPIDGQEPRIFFRLHLY